MCGRFTLRVKLNLLLDQFAAEAAELDDWEPRYNIAPTNDVLAVRQSSQGKREIVPLHWGLISSWAKDSKLAYTTINARADTVATKPAFRAAFKKRRCLVLTDGYFEWLKQGKARLPYLYEIGGKPFAMAGLWETWRGPEGSEGPPVESCTIITTDANKLASQIHDRMPVILDPVDYDQWLDPKCDDRDELEKLLVPYEGDELTVRPVSTYVNNVRNQGPECVAPPQ